MAYTLKQAADRLGKGKSTVKYHLKKLDPDTYNAYTSVDQNGIIHLTDPGFAYLCSVFGLDDPVMTEPEPPESDLPACDFPDMRIVLDVLTDQLRVKDEQLRAKDEQIKMLTEQVSTLMAQSNRPRRSFWQWLTGKD